MPDVVSDEQVAEIERDLAVQDPEPCDCSWKEPHTNFDCDYEERLWTWVRARDRIAAAAPLLLQALRDARDEAAREPIRTAIEYDHWRDAAIANRNEADSLRAAIEHALEDMGTSTLGAHLLRAALAAHTGQEATSG